MLAYDKRADYRAYPEHTQHTQPYTHAGRQAMVQYYFVVAEFSLNEMRVATHVFLSLVWKIFKVIYDLIILCSLCANSCPHHHSHFPLTIFRILFLLAEFD